MNPLKKFKFNFHLPHLKEIRKIWALEVIVAGILLLALLGWDAWIYFKLAEGSINFSATPDQSKVITLKKTELEAASKKLDAYNEFLHNPNFTF
ncbi:MAG: hypothetical protein Q8P07_01895 [bacterium]|nr:hypothetical protein [bacterium]